jgi:hypothetical protein
MRVAGILVSNRHFCRRVENRHSRDRETGCPALKKDRPRRSLHVVIGKWRGRRVPYGDPAGAERRRTMVCSNGSFGHERGGKSGALRTKIRHDDPFRRWRDRVAGDDSQLAMAKSGVREGGYWCDQALSDAPNRVLCRLLQSRYVQADIKAAIVRELRYRAEELRGFFSSRQATLIAAGPAADRYSTELFGEQEDMPCH